MESQAEIDYHNHIRPSELDPLHIRPPITGEDDQVWEVVSAAVHYATRARAQVGRGDDVVMTVVVPFDAPMRPLWELAEPILLEQHVELDWSRWDGWMVRRDEVGTDWDPEPFAIQRRSEWRISVSPVALGMPRSAGTAIVSGLFPDDARRAAARLLAIAELCERRQTEDLEKTS